MTNDPRPPDAKAAPALVVDLIEAFRRSKAMFAAVELGVFEGVRDGGAEFARLLEACVALGLLQKTGSGEFVNTAAADEYLRRDSPRTLTGYIRYSNAALYPMWANLEQAVREGGHRWTQTFGFEGSGIFDHFFRTPEAKREFLLGMHGFGLLSSPAVVSAFDLSRFKRLVDLGGATGHLALAAVHRYPEMTAVVQDLAPAIEFARGFVDHPRVELMVGDFFADPLPPADLYALGRILHDWSEPRIRQLLAKIKTALPAGGALLIAEKLLTASNVSAHMQSLNMLVCAEGRERTLDEYRALLQEAGFHSVQGVVTGTPLDAVLAIA